MRTIDQPKYDEPRDPIIPVRFGWQASEKKGYHIPSLINEIFVREEQRAS